MAHKPGEKKKKKIHEDNHFQPPSTGKGDML